MQNTINTSKPSKQLHQVSESVRDASEHFVSDLSNKARHLASDTTENMTEYYNQASRWMSQNSGKTLGVIGLVAVSGVIGFFIGRNRMPFSSSSSSDCDR